MQNKLSSDQQQRKVTPALSTHRRPSQHCSKMVSQPTGVWEPGRPRRANASLHCGGHRRPSGRGPTPLFPPRVPSGRPCAAPAAPAQPRPGGGLWSVHTPQVRFINAPTSEQAASTLIAAWKKILPLYFRKTMLFQFGKEPSLLPL